jgi:hypothetical protein
VLLVMMLCSMASVPPLKIPPPKAPALAESLLCWSVSVPRLAIPAPSAVAVRAAVLLSNVL